MGSSFTCKLNPCCGDMLNCNPPPQYSDRYADKPASPPVNAAAAVDGARRILADMASMRWGCSGRSMEYVNDWFNERAREALAALASPNAVEGEAVACQARFTISLFEDRSQIHTEASGGSAPLNLLGRAIAALQGEVDALAACPFHREDKL